MNIKKRKLKTNRKAMLEKLEKSIKRVVKKNTSDEESALVVYTTDSGIIIKPYTKDIEDMELLEMCMMDRPALDLLNNKQGKLTIQTFDMETLSERLRVEKRLDLNVSEESYAKMYEKMPDNSNPIDLLDEDDIPESDTEAVTEFEDHLQNVITETEKEMQQYICTRVNYNELKMFRHPDNPQYYDMVSTSMNQWIDVFREKNDGYWGTGVLYRCVKAVNRNRFPKEAFMNSIDDAPAYVLRRISTGKFTKKTFKNDYLALLIYGCTPPSNYMDMLSLLSDDESFLPYPGCTKEDKATILEDVTEFLTALYEFDNIFEEELSRKHPTGNLEEYEPGDMTIRVTNCCGKNEYVEYELDMENPLPLSKVPEGSYFYIVPKKEDEPLSETFGCIKSISNVFIKHNRMDEAYSMVDLTSIYTHLFLCYDKNPLFLRDDLDESVRKERAALIDNEYQCVLLKIDRKYTDQNFKIE